jgi:sortase (surface protein transpeptidase)
MRTARADGQYAVAVADLTPSPPPPQRRRLSRGLLLIGALLVGVALIVTTIVVTHGSRSGASGVATTPAAAIPPAAAAPAHPVASSSTTETTTPPPLVGSPNAKAPAPPAASKYGIPSRLIIPSIGVNTSLQSLGLAADGTMQAPSQWQVAGWYDKGVRPGDPGPAVIAGHVDSRNGPAVFYHLRNLKPGDRAQVHESGGRTLTFIVDTVQSYPKDHFPTAVVYAPTPNPVLRLITCTGDFDWTARSYLDNLVVSAHLVT